MFKCQIKSITYLVAIAVATLTPPAWAAIEIAPAPLYVGGFVPGSLALVPSVEFPTIISQANVGAYSASNEYTGYFDANKCYTYVNDPIEANRHFKPISKTTTRSCSGNWSGNFMNWAVTQTIDPFRAALTGGYRVRDTASETWLEKARHDRGGGYGDRTSNVAGTTPFSWGNFTIRVANLGNKMYFTGSGNVNNPGTVQPYPDSSSNAKKEQVFEASVRVKVCDSAFPEKNCAQYGSNWKPEGLIQQYSSNLQYSIFGYLNDSNALRDGGVMRAKNKFVGEYKLDASNNRLVTNPAREWDPSTGVLYRNPDSADAADTNAGIQDSGVINYLNKFGQMTTRQHKSYDPVSELYYAAIRYFKNLGNVPSYSDLTGDSNSKNQQADGFPVITRWDDPIKYWCQKNVILGIGDVNSHRDKNLPGSTNSSGEPAMPSEVSNDKTINVVTATQKIAQLEGINMNANAQFTGRDNSAYIAGLAYDAHTVDLRPEGTNSSSELLKRIKGMQTLSTYWVDVREGGVLANRNSNQYWLASKYGGFKVPNDFKPYDSQTTSIADALWYTTKDILSTGDKRPDNFFVASDAQNMVSGLTKAFASISAERTSSAAALTSSSNKIEPGVAVFQTTFSSSSWSGDLSAYAINQTTQKPETTPLWSAVAALPKPADRKIYFNQTPQAASGKTEFKSGASGLDSNIFTANVINYLRGDRSQEVPSGSFRARSSALGDIVNSAPVYVGSPNPRLYAKEVGYAQFAKDQAARTQMVYVGGNDGMLHGFNAKTGVEVFAFIPNAVLNQQLANTASPDYSHQYFVDGEISVADVYVGSRWKTILVASLGRGGRATFALDVTDPNNMLPLWENNPQRAPSIGQVLGKPVIAQLAKGSWSAIMGNGLNSAGDKAQLMMIDIESGDAKFIDTGIAGNNGLSAADVWDTNGDGIHDTAYAGDQRGNLWKFNLSKNNPTAIKLFSATSSSGAQAISAAPIAVVNPKTKVRWVFFGTGRFLNTNDLSNKDVQSWYGIIDSNQAVDRSSLMTRRILKDGSTSNGSVRVMSKPGANDMQGKSGWVIDFKGSGVAIEGERMLLPNQIRGNSLIGTSRIPDGSDPCLPEGRGYTMAIDPFSGGSLEQGFFDLNGDGKVDESDKIDGNYASGVGFDSSPNAPIFVGDGMISSLENAGTSHIKTQGKLGRIVRTSWREILGV
ncbi:pilus assembly protein [uncultured Deefgea sp.]|uniref:pilus assembly protein n=1 Tax=uncultured Deefgea sp. TaxID=1304914 RepID=UPI002593E730|nr:PilC/PilY family type IV pilus protein [uncultured Deefgea sp.]